MKSSLIIQEAKEVKAFVEKNKELPKFCTINGNEYSIYTTAYLFAKLLTNPKVADIKVLTTKSPSKTIQVKVNEQITSPDYRDMIKRFVAYIEKNKRLPAYVTSVKSKTKIRYDLFIYCLCKIIVFYNNNSNILPLYCVFNDADIKKSSTSVKTTQKNTATSTPKAVKKTNCDNPYKSSPHYLTEGCNKLGQCTGYWCGPHSIHQAIRKLGISKYTEKQIASWAGTTTSGTGHAGMNTAIAQVSKKSGVKLSVKWQNFSDMGSTDAERFKAIAKILCQENKAVIWHIAYIDGGASTNGKAFGHYECLDTIDTAAKTVRALNSLGTKKADGSYPGRLQTRSFSTQAYFAKHTSGGQPALCIITKG